MDTYQFCHAHLLPNNSFILAVIRQRCTLERSRYALGEAVYYECEQIVLLTNCTAFAGAGETGAADDAAWLDEATRGCYNLLCAATAAEVRRVIVVSCLDVFAPYGEDLAVDENFRPRPTVAPTQLGPHLTEFLAREFAHTHGGLNVTVARVGLLSLTDCGPDEQRAVEGLTGTLTCASAPHPLGIYFLPRARTTHCSQ
jgi:nucleoside-diphosphate-sugar epimerase